MSIYPIIYVTNAVFQDLKFISCRTGLCNWLQEDSGDFNWTLSSGLQVAQPWDGPEYDHTVGNKQGIKY